MLKGINDYTTQELAALTEEEVLSKLLHIEMMLNGVVLTNEPEQHHVEPIEKDLTFWVVSGRKSYSTTAFDCLFDTEEKAKAFAAMKPFAASYSDTEPDKRPEEYSVGPKLFFSKEKKARHKADIDLAAQMEKDNEEAWKRYNAEREAYTNLRSSLVSQHREAMYKMARAKELSKVFQEYVEMTSGDKTLAMNFLCKSAFASDWPWFLEHLALAGIEEIPQGPEE